MRWRNLLARKLRSLFRQPKAPVMVVESCSSQAANFPEVKKRKLERIRGLLTPGLAGNSGDDIINCLPPALREKYNIVDTENVSANEYDEIALDLINRFPDGMLMDCGAGLRGTYYSNVVNFEIVPYSTTDVLGVGEELPFRDDSFDAVLSLNVLEHVKDPFQCAREIIRVLKPGGSLYCVVPFLQALHAYPHHYYNMTHQGLRNLFDHGLEIEEQKVIPSGLPIWTLSWVLNNWADALPPRQKQEFLDRRVADLVGDPIRFLGDDFVTMLPEGKNFEMASTTALIARKPIPR